MAAQPRIVRRSEWGGRGSRSGTIAASQRRFYVVHWPVMSDRDERAWMRAIESIHINQGWGMIGYSYCVGQSGTVYEGCGLTTRPIHSPPRNSDGWGVCHLQPSTAGGTPTAPISQAMRNGSRQLYEWLSSQAGRRLNMWWHGRDFATACPGPDLRAWVSSGMPAEGGAQPPPPPQPQAQEDLMAAAVAGNGALTVFQLHNNWIWYTWQPPNQNAWNGGRAGRGPAGMSRFAPADGIVSISAETVRGQLHLFARHRDGSIRYTWQPGPGRWNGGKAGQQVAGLIPFAPAPG